MVMKSWMRMQLQAAPLVNVVLLGLLYLANAQQLQQRQQPQVGFAPSPAAEGPFSDGKTIDQGIAYVLLLVALAVTYLLH